MAFKGRYINIDEIIQHTKTHGPITTADAEKLAGDQPSTRIVKVDGEPNGAAVVSIVGKLMTVR